MARCERSRSSNESVQSWYGESVSYGSSTETRYGLGSPLENPSSAAAVRPPVVEEKYVTIGWPS